MPRIAVNADNYAATRVNIFFPAHNQTPKDGNLTGQCVTLNKWFMAEMTDVPSPFAARGDARYVGKQLVAEGHAVAVPYDQRRQGDFVVYEYGLYGHIGVLLSGDRIFEQNVNAGGAARKVVEGAFVYASRIGSLNESWRPVKPNIYRIKSYKEGSGSMLIQNTPVWKTRMTQVLSEITGDELSDNEFNAWVGAEAFHVVEALIDDKKRAAKNDGISDAESRLNAIKAYVNSL